VAGHIYSVYRLTEGQPYEVRRVAVEKETSRQIVTKGTGLAFGCSRRHSPEHVARSAQEAREHFMMELLEQRARLAARLAKIDELLPTVAAIPEAEEEDR
jgi:hypothetical protein